MQIFGRWPPGRCREPAWETVPATPKELTAAMAGDRI